MAYQELLPLLPGMTLSVPAGGKAGDLAIVRTLKEPLPEALQAEARAEIALLERAVAPEIMPPWEVEVTSQGAMAAYPWRDGVPLAGALARAREAGLLPPIRVAGRLVGEALNALGVLHTLTSSSGAPSPVIHGAFRADSLWLGFDGKLQLCDVGFASVGSRVETPSYAGRDPRSDVHAAGVLAHVVLTGAMPTPSTEGSDPAQLNPEVGDAMAAVVKRATHSDPSQRYANAVELKAAWEETLGEIGGIATHGQVGRWLCTIFPANHPLVAALRATLVPLGGGAVLPTNEGPILSNPRLAPVRDAPAPSTSSPRAAPVPTAPAPGVATSSPRAAPVVSAPAPGVATSSPRAAPVVTAPPAEPSTVMMSTPKELLEAATPPAADPSTVMMSAPKELLAAATPPVVEEPATVVMSVPPQVSDATLMMSAPPSSADVPDAPTVMVAALDPATVPDSKVPQEASMRAPTRSIPRAEPVVDGPAVSSRATTKTLARAEPVRDAPAPTLSSTRNAPVDGKRSTTVKRRAVAPPPEDESPVDDLAVSKPAASSSRTIVLAALSAVVGGAVVFGGLQLVNRPAAPEVTTSNDPLAKLETPPPKPREEKPPEKQAPPEKDEPRSTAKEEPRPSKTKAPPPKKAAPAASAEPSSDDGNMATLQLTVTPWADVWVDGKKRGRTPMKPLKLRPGKHVIKLENTEWHVKRTDTVELQAGGWGELTITFTPPG